MTGHTLVRWGGPANIVSGAITAVFWFVHPGRDGLSAETAGRWMAVNGSFILVLVACLLGLVALYARQHAQVGTLGALGFLAAFVGSALFIGAGTLDTFVAPVLHAEAPALLALDGPLFGGPIGGLFGAAGMLFGLGFVAFGVATARGGVLPAIPAVMVALGSPILGLSPLMPWGARVVGCALFGVGSVWLGWMLWRQMSD